ncbi:nuclear transport factor 2 family protein [Sphingobium sp. WCS2017Hpa-17]|uniref:nuclear transport factor 2 family protein n=1 Tax=Sphingobium sp. WCS2017Hpa-17 TaxID=3073638 RepID=UPI00288AD10A|nr:nuclear transport factor 2 family protein [Sphingobium sp. WCS2017Hpa-17]
MSVQAAHDQIAAARGRLPRETIEGAVRAFEATYARKDWETRAALLSQDAVFEDTVGVPPPAIGRQAAADYFRLIIASGWNVEMRPRQIIVMGDEAFVITDGQWGVEGEAPVKLMLIQNFKFNENGEICHVRIAYDEGCIMS